MKKTELRKIIRELIREWAPKTNLLQLKGPPMGAVHSCCPTIYNNTTGYPSVSPCAQGGQGGFNLYTGAPVLGTGCGPDPNAAAGGADPEWCCEWAIIVGWPE